MQHKITQDYLLTVELQVSNFCYEVSWRVFALQYVYFVCVVLATNANCLTVGYKWKARRL